MPYCDGSVFGGDNAVEDDPRFDIRHHRGLRNLSAGMDVARAEFKRPEKIVVAGSSAGGVGAAAFAPFLARFTYGNSKELFVFNDAGPIVVNLGSLDAVEARALDWGFEQFYPASCTECSAFGQQTAIVDWRLDNDSTIREAFYETDADATNIGFACANLPGFFDPLPPAVPFDITLFNPPFNLGCAMSQSQYRALVLEGISVDPFGVPFRDDDAHDALNAAHPDRYKRFIVSGDTSHTALQSIRFYDQTADGVPLNEWTGDFIEQPGQDSVWVDIVEEFDELP
jgi:hypothetical protein